MRRSLALLLVAATALSACGKSEPKSGLDLSSQLGRLKGSPPALASLHRRANKLLDGEADAFKAELAKLRGHPVVVNKWASWCGPCRLEFPIFQRVGAKLGKRTAFLGVDANDNDGSAQRFLDQYPVSYPSFKDPSLKVSQVLGATVAWPSTAFYDRTGKLAYLHQGPYADDAALMDDIKRYTR